MQRLAFKPDCSREFSHGRRGGGRYLRNSPGWLNEVPKAKLTKEFAGKLSKCRLPGPISRVQSP